MNDYQIGMFGLFEFTIRKKDKYVDYIPHAGQGVRDGYKKFPLYRK